MSETSEFRAINWFTPLRFGFLLALLIFAAFPQVLFNSGEPPVHDSSASWRP